MKDLPFIAKDNKEKLRFVELFLELLKFDKTENIIKDIIPKLNEKTSSNMFAYINKAFEFIG